MHLDTKSLGQSQEGTGKQENTTLLVGEDGRRREKKTSYGENHKASELSTANWEQQTQQRAE